MRASDWLVHQSITYSISLYLHWSLTEELAEGYCCDILDSSAASCA